MSKPNNQPRQAPPEDPSAGPTDPGAGSSDPDPGASAEGDRDPAVEQLIEDVMRDAQGAGEGEGEGGASGDAPATLESALAMLGLARDELEQARAEANEGRESALRARAEGDNVRKRAERDVEKAHRFALEGFAKELLPVIDALEMGLKSTPEDAQFESLRQGTEMVLGMLTAACAKYGLEQIDPEGEPFDPERHQAMATAESEGDAGLVVQVHQRGYLLNGRLVRPALVVVSK